MTTAAPPTPTSASSGSAPGAPAPTRPRRAGGHTSLAAHGEGMLWLTGGALVVCVVMILGLLLLVVRNGAATFWPRPIERVELVDGSVHLGEVTRRDVFEPDEGIIETYGPELRAAVEAELAAGRTALDRRLLRTANFELTGRHFTWVTDAAVVERTLPEWALVIERVDGGRFYGLPSAWFLDGERVAEAPAEVWERLQDALPAMRERRREHERIEEHELAPLAARRERARLRAREVELDRDIPNAWATAYREAAEARAVVERADDPVPADLRRVEQAQDRLDRLERLADDVSESDRAAYADAVTAYLETIRETELINTERLGELDALDAEDDRHVLGMTTGDGRTATIPIDDIVRIVPVNQLSTGGRVSVYLDRWREFLLDDPRDANQEGGVFPAIVGTVLMTLIMVVLGVPFGVLAALYLREYARSGPVVSVLRIAINNLAGVPSIVFGVFGLGFFCYGVGGFIDGGPSYTLPTAGWFWLLAGLVVVSAGAGATSILAGRASLRPKPRLRLWIARSAGALWLLTALAAVTLIATTPFFDGFYRASLPNPTFGKGALIWASFTLALLTLPVVIVATEEALSAVPNSMREGSYACGASKWQTIKRIVLPRAMPGIMTGTILAMARGAGEVAPLMLVGAVKLSLELPFSPSPAEQFGVNRSFMHLGFTIYDLGFQSPNAEAAKPLVFTITLLLIAIIAALNLGAIALRARLRRRFVGAQF